MPSATYTSTRSARFAPEIGDVEMDGSRRNVGARRDGEMDGSRRSVGSRRSNMDSSAASQRTSLDGSVYDLPCSLSIVDEILR